jgi:hypothetical protein
MTGEPGGKAVNEKVAMATASHSLDIYISEGVFTIQSVNLHIENCYLF